MRTRATSRLIRGLVAAAIVAWAGWGLHGSVVYGSNYSKYRGFAPPHDPKGIARGRIVHVSFFSRALGQRRSYLIYLPAGYRAAARGGRRYPVYYFLHGSPGRPALAFDAAGMGVAYDVLLHKHRINPFLIVVPNGRNGTFRSDTEWANTRRGGRYGSFVMDVVRAVDARWATIPNRQDRMIGGYSEGAYAALNLSLHHLRTFGSFESWSGYVQQSATSGPFAGEPSSVVQANEPNLYLPRVAAEVRRDGLAAYLYTGTRDYSRNQVAAYAQELRAAGAQVTFSMFRGGHNWRLWRRETPRMVLWAGQTLGR
jgi:enterochelin esterase-like enzyme